MGEGVKKCQRESTIFSSKSMFNFLIYIWEQSGLAGEEALWEARLIELCGHQRHWTASNVRLWCPFFKGQHSRGCLVDPQKHIGELKVETCLSAIKLTAGPMVCTLWSAVIWGMGWQGPPGILQMSLEKMFSRRMAHPTLCLGEWISSTLGPRDMSSWVQKMSLDQSDVSLCSGEFLRSSEGSRTSEVKSQG